VVESISLTGCCQKPATVRSLRFHKMAARCRRQAKKLKIFSFATQWAATAEFSAFDRMLAVRIAEKIPGRHFHSAGRERSFRPCFGPLFLVGGNSGVGVDDRDRFGDDIAASSFWLSCGDRHRHDLPRPQPIRLSDWRGTRASRHYRVKSHTVIHVRVAISTLAPSTNGRRASGRLPMPARGPKRSARSNA
jgi:hypothetical protein